MARPLFRLPSLAMIDKHSLRRFVTLRSGDAINDSGQHDPTFIEHLIQINAIRR